MVGTTPSKVCEHCGQKYSKRQGDSNFARNKTCSRGCRYERLKRNTTRVDDHGYVRFNRTGKRLHRVVVEGHLGRSLEPWEEVHHKDGDKQNNDIANLQVLSKPEHTRVTFRGKKRLGLRGRLA